MKVYVLLNTWNDRHGTSGTNIDVFDDDAKAKEAMLKDIEKYKADVGEPDIEPEDQSDNGCYIDVDNCGTNSEWDIMEKEVK